MLLQFADTKPMMKVRAHKGSFLRLIDYQELFIGEEIDNDVILSHNSDKIFVIG
jgi:hypothetical protein